MSESSEDEDVFEAVASLNEQASILAKQTNDFQQALEGFTAFFAERLKTEVAAIRDRSKQNRNLNLIVFVLVVLFAISSVHFLITRGITRPVPALVTTAQGDVSQ